MARALRGLWMLALCAAAAAAPPAPLAFRIDEGRNINSFLRSGPVAAHLLLRAGNEPRILVAFPAGNSGVGLWFEKSAAPVTWTLISAPKAITRADAKHRPLHGIEFEVTVDAPELRAGGAVLSSIRVLRDYELQKKAPPEVLVEARVTGPRIEWARDRLDGAAGYRLSIETVGGPPGAGPFTAAAGKPLRLKIQAMTGEAPLTPLPAIVSDAAGDDRRARDALAFLSYGEKFLAGSWRFDTYFGRDTLISALLLGPALSPTATESALSSVLERLAPNGEVAHEEDIGEFAVLRNAREGRGRVATPIYDYGMVDDDFLLAPLAARWLVDDPRGAARAKTFLAATLPAGGSRGDALARNFVWAVERTRAFADAPRVQNLVGIKAGRTTGQWRDSDRGLGGGRYAYDVNTALVPEALRSIMRINDTGLLDAYLSGAQRRVLAWAHMQAYHWTKRAPAMFDVSVDAGRARAAIKAYAAGSGVNADAALRALGESGLAFHALSLDERGNPIPILHSDEGFRLLLTEPTPAQIERCLTAVLRPFPAGLLTDVGLLVANPAQAPAALQRDFDRFAYHGAVVWSWQQALMAAGIDQQLRRVDLPPATRAQLEQARKTIWKAIDDSRALRTSELWSWSYAGGRYRIEAFGRPGADVDESNAAQLWSTVFLGMNEKELPVPRPPVKPPAPFGPDPVRTDTSPGS